MILRNILLFFLFLLILQTFFLPSKTFASTQPVINEFLAHPSSPNKEWVEIYNPDNVDLSNYWIDDDTDFTNDSGNSTKKVLSSLNTSNASYSYIELSSSMFNNGEDSVVLFDNSGHIVDQYHYASDPGVDNAIGRTPDGMGDFVALSSATKGLANTLPQPTSTPTTVPSLTPTKSPSPTHTPTATKAPTPTKTPTPTKAPTNKPAATATAKPASVVASKLASVLGISNHPSLDPSLFPTAILDASVSASPFPTKKISPTMKKPQIKEATVLGTSGFNSTHLLMSIGGLLLLSCGILGYLNWKKRQKLQ